MKPFATCLMLLLPTLLWGTPPWDSRRLTDDFHAEGAGVGDIDGDGRPDLTYGPFWLPGPDFTQKHRFAAGEKFSPIGYSDNFFAFVEDLTGDGRKDIVVFGFPGTAVRLYVNPGPTGMADPWPMHVIADQLCHEAPTLMDLVPGGGPEIVGARDTTYGYYTANADATQAWTWRAISAPGRAQQPFGHGLGVGDINGDGRLDVIEKTYWYEQPASAAEEWKEHRWAPAPYAGGAQILVDDVDGDGDSDIITSLEAHGAGIAWFEQTQPGSFRRQDIIGASSTDSPFGVTFLEPHGLGLADIDGDGLRDFVSGKRWLAHNGRDAGAHQEPVVYWFRKVKTETSIEFVPHLVDNASGIGVCVPIGDLNGDGRLDIVSANKRGLTLHLQTPQILMGAAERWKTPPGRPQEDAGKGLSPAEAAAKFSVPPGFAVDLIASEPQVTQPIAMCFDARGRLWVVEGQSYPQRAPEGQGRDRVLIFEDADSDGRFETRKVFADKLNLVSGIQVGFGGVFVGAAPHLLFMADRDGDDVPDAAPEVLLDGWGYQDTHETLNSFTWGPDGWLYGCHGVFTHSKVGKPGAADADRLPINAGVWRFHPIRRTFEVFAEGSSNPWGIDFDAHGDAFITACVVPHLYHVIQGGRYTRQAGQHFHPYIFEDIKTIADHRHFVGRVSDNAFHGPNRDQPPSINPDTSALGGGHAHAGLVIYQSNHFPPTYRGDLFFSNLHGHRLVRERLEHDGSGYIARHQPDFALAQDLQFIGVSVQQGPDGALYVSDWHDKQTCHHRDVNIWTRSDGRIFRIRYGATLTPKLDLNHATNTHLVNTLAHRNVVHARLAQRLLQERMATAPTNVDELRALLADFERQHASDAALRLRGFWAAHSCGLLAESDLLERLRDSDEYVRGWALQFLGETKGAMSAAALAAVEKLALSESSMVTRRFVASLLQRLPTEQRWPIAAALIRHANDQHDRNIPLLAWYGIEPLTATDPARALTLSDRTAWTQLREFIARRAAQSPEGREALMTSLAKAKDASSYTQRGTQLLLALAQLPGVARPAGWELARATGERLQTSAPTVLEVVRQLGARFGDAEYFDHWRRLARNGRATTADRIQAIEILQAGADPLLGALVRELIDEKPLQPTLVKALRSAPGTDTARALVARLPSFPLELRNEAIGLLATRPEMALVLLQAVDAKQLTPALISPIMLDQFARFQNADITAIIDRHWARGGSGVELSQLAGAIGAWKSKLNDRVLQQADAARGRRVYQSICGNCHPLFGEGVALGPDLTGSNRANLSYILENVLAPSAVVGRDYLQTVFELQDGSIVTGLIRHETPEFVTVALAGGAKVDIKLADIASRQQSPVSFMPTAMFDKLPTSQVADLVKYLASPTQTPLPAGDPPIAGLKPAAAPTTPATPAGVVRIEAEALRPNHAKVTGGELRRQEMAGFRNDVWSGNAQLFWVSVERGHVLTLTLPDVKPGLHDVTLFPTLARDYGKFRLTISGVAQEADLFSKDFVKLAPPVTFRKIPVAADKPLTIVIEPVGANPDAKIGKFGYVFGLDRIEVGSTIAAVPEISKFDRPVSGSLHINQQPDSLRITANGADGPEVMRFQMKPTADSGVIVPSAAYFHPLRTPAGVTVTALAPKAHPYYRGLFMGFVDTRGLHDANFWGGGGGPIKGSEVVNHAVSDLRPGTNDRPASFRASNEWRYAGVGLVKEELRARTQLDGSATILDLTYLLTAVGEHRLAHCNVGGLALPVRTDGTLTAHGPTGPITRPSAVYRINDTNWPAADWYGYTLQLSEGTASAAIIDHPENPETRWHVALGARVLNPCISTTREIVLRSDAPLVLRYRVIITDGPFDLSRMRHWRQSFIDQSE